MQTSVFSYLTLTLLFVAFLSGCSPKYVQMEPKAVKTWVDTDRTIDGKIFASNIFLEKEHVKINIERERYNVQRRVTKEYQQSKKCGNKTCLTLTIITPLCMPLCYLSCSDPILHKDEPQFTFYSENDKFRKQDIANTKYTGPVNLKIENSTTGETVFETFEVNKEGNIYAQRSQLISKLKSKPSRVIISLAKNTNSPEINNKKSKQIELDTHRW